MKEYLLTEIKHRDNIPSIGRFISFELPKELEFQMPPRDRITILDMNDEIIKFERGMGSCGYGTIMVLDTQETQTIKMQVSE